MFPHGRYLSDSIVSHKGYLVYENRRGSGVEMTKLQSCHLLVPIVVDEHSFQRVCGGLN